ncbi:serine hydrolase domain-containing protein [Actinomadura sp. HBU206391]|uniref:serine hydrolase domain-containing protein n=1 Tax=Actinomadura sp. HBU206391 TaxID=2731692 RepID=UPI001C9C8F21|nr:serine hydrolase [Actinomadura sp. HBU206391]
MNGRISGGLVALLILTACSSENGGEKTPVDVPSPGRTFDSAWEQVAPDAVGLDAAELERLAAVAERGQSTCLVVVRDGKLAGEWYFQGTDQDTGRNVYSVTKSVASTLVGIAQDDGDLRIGDRASKWITEWKGTPSEAVTVRDLLSNDSGREWSTDTDYRRLLGARDRTAFAIGLKQARPPGEVWAYNNSAVQTLQRILQKATGQDVAAFARQRLFEPLGMSRSTLTTDRAGNAQLFMGMQSTCRDMARFGLLMLNNGRWDGRQIVSADWVKEATGRSSTKLNAAYGHLWWLNRRGPLGEPLAATGRSGAGRVTKTGRLVPGGPDRMYWALGFGNQLIQVDPGSGTVVVRVGPGRLPRPPTFGPAEASKITEAVKEKE